MARRLLAVAGVILILMLVVLVALYAARREVARQVLIGWLEQRGIEADIQVERLELDQLIARITVGDSGDPDFAVERVEVDYALAWPWSSTGLGATPSRIRLLRPILRASWKDGAFSMGALDPLVEEFAGRPPGPEARGPLVVIEQGRLSLDSDYGPLIAHADARIEDGRLMRLTARAPAASLRSADTSLDLTQAALDLTTTGQSTRIDFRLDAAAASTAGLALEDISLSLLGDLPYPELEARRSRGPASLAATLAVGEVRQGGIEDRTEGQDVALTLNLDGRFDGWLETFDMTGQGEAVLTAASLSGSGGAVREARVALAETELSVSRAGAGPLAWRSDGPAALTARSLAAGDLDLTSTDLRTHRLSMGGRMGGGRSTALEASAPVNARADRLAYGDLRLAGLDGRMELDLVGEGGLRLALDGGLSARSGAWPLLGPAAPDDAAEMAGLKRALADFSLSAPALRLAMDGSGGQVALTRPAVIRPANGGALTLTAHAAAPLYTSRRGETGGGAVTLAARSGGHGATDIRAEIPDWRLIDGGFSARLDAQAAFDFDFIRGGRLQTQGLLTSRSGALTYAPASCIPVSIDRMVFGENEAVQVSGQACPPAAAPMLTVRDGTWSARTRIDDVQAVVPFLEMRFDQTRGEVMASGGSSGLTLDARIPSAQVTDVSQPERFRTLNASGQAGLSGEVWSGRFDLAAGRWPLGMMILNHDGRAASGGVQFDVSGLTFTETGLQPDDLTPLTEGLIDPPVSGRAGFTGRFDWTPEGATSSGRLEVERLDFVSPAGAVTGLSGTVDFTSLTPLVTAPDQRLTAEGLAALSPITDLELLFELGAESLRVSGADLDVAGGHVLIEPFEVPLDRTQPFAGTLVFENVQLGELIAGSGFGEQVRLDAVVSGRVPFIHDPAQGWRVTDGSLHAVRPGRLEIAREALSGLEAGGGGEDVPPNVVQDLAYQAMEDLAFDVLTAQVNSLDEGRLGVVFRIRGRHDPPQRQELRLSLQELISRRFLNRELPLPSGTEIDLTLDTTLNVNQLISDFLALQRARRGERDAADVSDQGGASGSLARGQADDPLVPWSVQTGGGGPNLPD